MKVTPGSGGRGAGVPVDDALDVAEVVHVARDGDSARVVEAVLLLRCPEQGYEERVVEVPHRHQEPLLLLPLPPDPNRYPPLGRWCSRRLPCPRSPAHSPVRAVQVNPQHMMCAAASPAATARTKQEKLRRTSKIRG
ncbi:unnamed protein product [Musa banksii]